MKIALAAVSAATGLAVGWVVMPGSPQMAFWLLAGSAGLSAVGLAGFMLSRRAIFALLAAAAIGYGVGHEVSYALPPGDPQMTGIW